MAERKIVTTAKDEAFLRKKSRPVEVLDDKLKELVADMYETMRKEDGCGLAAVQIGLLKRVAVVEAEGRTLELINAEIVEREGEQTDYEGCLSIRGRNDMMVTRAKKVTVVTCDLKGKRKKVTVSGWLARAVQHEMDHWDGILFIDRGFVPTPEQEERYGRENGGK